jgi:hypothetical protein
MARNTSFWPSVLVENSTAAPQQCMLVAIISKKNSNLKHSHKQNNAQVKTEKVS